jgi:hypothetical protein
MASKLVHRLQTELDRAEADLRISLLSGWMELPQLAGPPLTISAATDQTRPLEDLQATRDGGQTDRERLGQLDPT